MKKSILFVTALLCAASVFMIVSSNQSGQTQLQSAPVTPQELKAAEKPDNIYVIRNGSNELPPGVQGEDPNKKPSWMPAWQKDRILDQQGVPMVGTPQQMYGKNADGSPAVSSGSSDSQAPAASTGGGITPAVATGSTSMSGHTSGGITPATGSDMSVNGQSSDQSVEIPSGNESGGPSTYGGMSQSTP